MITITQAAYIAKSRNTTYWLSQVNRDLPYGDIAAMIDVAKNEGAIVTQSDGNRFIINNTAWVSVYGNVTPL